MERYRWDRRPTVGHYHRLVAMSSCDKPFEPKRTAQDQQ